MGSSKTKQMIINQKKPLSGDHFVEMKQMIETKKVE
jgi:hypothetical protein